MIVFVQLLPWRGVRTEGRRSRGIYDGSDVQFGRRLRCALTVSRKMCDRGMLIVVCLFVALPHLDDIVGFPAGHETFPHRHNNRASVITIFEALHLWGVAQPASHP